MSDESQLQPDRPREQDTVDYTSRPPAWDEGWETLWSQRPNADPTRIAVRVVHIDKGGITVSPNRGEEQLVVAAKSVRRVVVGDVCALDTDSGRIEEILARRTVFERRAPGGSRDDIAVTAKALAANMDVVLVLQPLDVGVNTSRLAREIVLAWESGARPVVVLTKTDLVDASIRDEQRRTAQRFAPEVPVTCVSTRHRVDLHELQPLLPAGSVSALLGASGAGKSTLANALAGHLVQLTAEVREGDLRGRHTTTAGQMLALAGDRWLIDTPGIRAVGLWHADAGLEKAFIDLTPFAQQCRFTDCTHTSEPDCGLLAAVNSGEVAEDRLAAWHGLLGEVEELEAMSEQHERDALRDANQRSRRRAAAQRGRPRR